MTTAVSNTPSPVSTAPSAPVNPKSTMGKDEFLKLLVAQMKNQDPMNPSGGDQMAAQLAQFSSLEQLQNINSTLTTQTSATGTVIDSIQTSAAMGTIGKNVVAGGDALEIKPGSDATTATVRATIPAGGGQATLKIMDNNGNVIATRDLGEVNGGTTDIALGSAGSSLPAGTYHFAVSVTGAGGSPHNAPTFVVGKVDSVVATSRGPVLMIGGIAVPFNTVTEIRN